MDGECFLGNGVVLYFPRFFFLFLELNWETLCSGNGSKQTYLEQNLPDHDVMFLAEVCFKFF